MMIDIIHARRKRFNLFFIYATWSIDRVCMCCVMIFLMKQQQRQEKMY